MKLLTDISIAPSGGFKGFGPIGNMSGPGSGVTALTNVISTVIGLMTIVAFIWFVFVVIAAAIGWIGAGGDKQAIESARKRLTNGLVGLIVTIAAVFLIDIIGNILGIGILDLPTLFNQII